jgi:hypothetical protein
MRSLIPFHEVLKYVVVDHATLMTLDLTQRIEDVFHGGADVPKDHPDLEKISEEAGIVIPRDETEEPMHYTSVSAQMQEAYPGYTGAEPKENRTLGVLARFDPKKLHEGFWLPWDGFLRDLGDPTKEVLLKSPLKRAEDAAWYGCDMLGQIWRFADTRHSIYGKVKR